MRTIDSHIRREGGGYTNDGPQIFGDIKERFWLRAFLNDDSISLFLYLRGEVTTADRQFVSAKKRHRRGYSFSFLLPIVELLLYSGREIKGKEIALLSAYWDFFSSRFWPSLTVVPSPSYLPGRFVALRIFFDLCVVEMVRYLS